MSLIIFFFSYFYIEFIDEIMNLLPNVDLKLDTPTIRLSGLMDSQAERWKKGMLGWSSPRN